MTYRIVKQTGTETNTQKYFIQYKRCFLWWNVKRYEFGKKLTAYFINLNDCINHMKQLAEKKTKKTIMTWK